MITVPIDRLWIELNKEDNEAVLIIEGIKFCKLDIISQDSHLKVYPKKVSRGAVMAVYRNLRENFEYRMRYDEAGEFFVREMELKRKRFTTNSARLFVDLCFRRLFWSGRDATQNLCHTLPI